MRQLLYVSIQSGAYSNVIFQAALACSPAKPSSKTTTTSDVFDSTRYIVLCDDNRQRSIRRDRSLEEDEIEFIEPPQSDVGDSVGSEDIDTQKMLERFQRDDLNSCVKGVNVMLLTCSLTKRPDIPTQLRNLYASTYSPTMQHVLICGSVGTCIYCTPQLTPHQTIMLHYQMIGDGVVVTKTFKFYAPI